MSILQISFSSQKNSSHWTDASIVSLPLNRDTNTMTFGYRHFEFGYKFGYKIFQIWLLEVQICVCRELYQTLDTDILNLGIEILIHIVFGYKNPQICQECSFGYRNLDVKIGLGYTFHIFMTLKSLARDRCKSVSDLSCSCFQTSTPFSINIT